MFPNQRPASHWQNQWNQWQNRARQQAIQSQREHQEAIAAETQRIRIFGGEKGDDVSLCPSMVQVVVGLFGGLDYEDP